MATIDVTRSDGPEDLVADAAFKLGMRRLVASVCLITAGAGTARVGLTATAVCSVSAEPPTLLCSINRSSASYATIIRSEAFAVNVLTMHDLELANRFASRMPSEEKFLEGDWRQGRSPLLRSAIASFDCKVIHHVEASTHGILLGQVCALDLQDESVSPLLYAHGRYGAFADA